MPSLRLAQGKLANLSNEPLQEGLLSFVIDEGKIYLDQYNELGKLERIPFYSGTLTIGNQVFDGTEDVTIQTYGGEIE